MARALTNSEFKSIGEPESGVYCRQTNGCNCENDKERKNLIKYC